MTFARARRRCERDEMRTHSTELLRNRLPPGLEAGQKAPAARLTNLFSSAGALACCFRKEAVLAPLEAAALRSARLVILSRAAGSASSSRWPATGGMSSRCVCVRARASLLSLERAEISEREFSSRVNNNSSSRVSALLDWLERLHKLVLARCRASVTRSRCSITRAPRVESLTRRGPLCCSVPFSCTPMGELGLHSSVARGGSCC